MDERITIDKKLNPIYTSITNILRRTIHDPYAAENLFWIQTYQLIAQSKIDCKNDVMGFVMLRIKGSNNSCSDIGHMVEEKTKEYLQFDQDYHISDVLDDLGDQWKRMICRTSITPMFSFRVWLKLYVGECMPAINKMISEWEAEGTTIDQTRLTEDDLKERQKAYRAARARLKKLLKKLDAVKEYDAIRRQDPDYFKDVE